MGSPKDSREPVSPSRSLKGSFNETIMVNNRPRLCLFYLFNNTVI